ncbi:MAG: methyltransferase [Cyclobacteriaceae bacterium]
MKVGTDAILLGAWASIAEAKRILDIGTGSGVIALMLAQRSDSNVSIVGIEPDLSSFIQASENFNASHWSSRLQLMNIRLQDLKDDDKFDLIVSNPPFFSSGLKPPVDQRKSARHTHALSHEELVLISSRLLRPGGRLSLVLPSNEGQRLIIYAEKVNLHCSRICSVKTRVHKPVERLLIEFSTQRESQAVEELLLELSDGKRTAAYDALVSNFYLAT